MENQEQPPNSALDVKLDYIQRDMREIKTDIKEMKNDYVSRREFVEAMATLREEMSPLKKIAFGLVSVIGLAVIGALMKLVLLK